MKTIKLLDQLRASRDIYERELKRYDQLSDAELTRALALASDSTIERVLAIASDSTIARVLRLATDSTIARVLALASDSTIASVLGLATDSTIARINAQVPIVEDLDQRMLGAVEAGALDMRNWHCGTTHCRAGWAITFAGDEGTTLERLVGPETAGRLIYEASTGRIAPDFYASNEDAIADIRRCAGVEVTP